MSRGTTVRDGWRFAVGTLTAVPVRAPRTVDREVTGLAMVLGPVAVIPLAVLVGLICWAGRELGLAPFGTAAAAIAALALGSRAFHLDGLADTADGLTASYDRERSLAIMRTGDTGPAGAAVLVLTLGVQVGALTSLHTGGWGPLSAGVLVCVSRGALLITCQRAVPAARTDGLGSMHAGAVSPVAGILVGLVLTAATTGAFLLTGLDWWRGPVSVAAAIVIIGLLVRHAVKRVGGVTGDVYGASIEIALAVLLLTAT